MHETNLAPHQLTQLSKRMAYLLRHNPPPEMGAGGFVPLPAILRHLGPGATEAAVRRVVATDGKGRYQLNDSTAPAQIRAVQGHSVQLEAPLLHPVADAAAVPLAVHVTSEEGWRAIQESGELRRMSRTHIHFATQPNHLRANSWATVLLQLDVAGAMQAGHELLLASNGVLLTVGPLPVRHVRRVQRQDLPLEWRQRRQQQQQQQQQARGRQKQGGQELRR